MEPQTKPWRPNNVGWGKDAKEGLMQTIRDYSPLLVDQVNILMAGPIGDGKSSFFNTINSIFRGHVTGQAVTGTTNKALTTHYRKYPVRMGRGGDPMRFRLCDTMGIEEEGLDPEDFKGILDGNIPDRYVFNPGTAVNAEMPGFKKDPDLNDKIHVAAYIIDGSRVSIISATVLEKLRKIRQFTNQRGIPLVVIVTKVDTICEHVQDDLKTVYLSPNIAERIQEVSDKIGIPKAHILVVKNYESEIELDENVDILALTAMRQILRLADNFLDDQLDQQEEAKAEA